MSNRYVRIYAGHTPETNIIGFSMSAADAAIDPRLGAFLSERGYDMRRPEQPPVRGLSASYVEIEPPLDQEDLQAFGYLCTGQVVEGRWQDGIVDPGSNSVVVYDNRAFLPRAPLGGGKVVIQQ